MSQEREANIMKHLGGTDNTYHNGLNAECLLKSRSSLPEIEASLDIVDILFPQIADRSWLTCKPFPVGSVFGLDYEDERTGNDIRYSLQVHKLVVDEERREQDPAPLSNVAQHPGFRSHPLMDKNSADPVKQKRYTRKDTILWYDLTAYANNVNWNSKQVLLLLRNLLGVSHSASPWCPHEVHDESACVILFFESEDLKNKLIDFRTSDASPSWCRFCEVTLSHLPKFYEGSASANQENDHFYSMFVFRHLPERPRLSRLHPVSQQPTPQPGCLWETIKIKQTNSWIHRPVAPPYIDPRSEVLSSKINLFSLLEEANIAVLRKEALSLSSSSWTPWPEEAHYATKPNGAAPWRVVPLLHCFPATDETRRQWLDTFCDLCQGTVRILKECIGEKYLRTALWSRLDPDSVLEAHTGWADLANHVLRVHVPVVVPADGVCGIWVDGCVAESSDIAVFDDSKTHRAFNYSETEERIVLIIDIVRPSQLPQGTATGGHSDELDSFIQQFSKAM